MQAIDNQIAREMQRTPAELEAHGVQKWEPYAKRIELVSAFTLTALGEEQISLDAVLVLTQALAKTLQLVVEDLGTDGLGKVRTSYCVSAADVLSRTAHEIQTRLKGGEAPEVC